MYQSRIGILLVALIACGLLICAVPGEAAKTPIPYGGGHGGHSGYGGHYGHYHGGYHGGYGHYHGGYYGYGYHSYYPYYYYPWYWGFTFGLGYYYPYYPTYAWPYYYPPAGYAPDYYYPTGDIRAEVKPNTAKVYVDGEDAGAVSDYDGWWQRLKVAPGKHVIVFRAPGFKPYAVTMDIAPGQDYHIKYQMEAGEDVIPEDQMRPPRDQRDNQYGNRYPRNPYRNQPRQAPPNEQNGPEQPGDEEQGYQGDEGYGGDQGYGYPGYGGQQPQHGNLQNMEMLYMQVQPADATIYIDGNYYGTASVQGSDGSIKALLPKGQHKIEVVRPGYKAYSQTVDLEPGANNRLNVTLESK